MNSTSLYNVRTEGDSAYVQFDDATQALNVLFYQFLGIRTISNETDVNYQVNRWLGLSGGYQYSDRLIRSAEEVTIAGSPSLLPYSQTNLQHTERSAFACGRTRGSASTCPPRPESTAVH